MKLYRPWLVAIAIKLFSSSLCVVAQPMPSRLHVSPDGHGLVNEAGTPFFWLGDTAWNYFARLNQTEANQYLTDRTAKRFTVIQAHLLPWTLSTRSVQGQTAFMNGDVDQPNEAYWQHVDTLMRMATEQGFYMAVLPAWARTYIELTTNKSNQASVVLTDSAKAYRYGRFLGQRYRAYTNLIWVLGGDCRPMHHAVYRQLARGLTDTYASGNPDRILLTYHPPGGTYRPPATSSGEFYHNEPWLDLNMIQSGHALANASYQRITDDYARLPVKPTLDAEPCYEQHPVKHKYTNGRFTSWHVRRRAWWSVLAGASGFTYGGNGVWQMDKPGDVMEPDHFSHVWYDGLKHEGAGQMQYVRTLVEALGTGQLIPDSTRLRTDSGTIDNRVQVARDRSNRLIVAYITDGHPIRLDLSIISKRKLRGFWFDPRTGKQRRIKRVSRGKSYQFIPPTSGAEQDWVMVVRGKETG